MFYIFSLLKQDEITYEYTIIISTLFIFIKNLIDA